MLYPTELLGHISKIFNFSAQTDSNELPLRRRTLYPGEVRGHEPKYFTPFVRACQLRKLLTQAARRPHIKNRPRAGLPGAGQNTAGGQRIRSADYVIPYHGIIGKRVLSKNIISARVTKYITYICSINPPKYSELMHVTTLYAFCSSFQKSSSKISSVPTAQTGKRIVKLSATGVELSIP